MASTILYNRGDVLISVKGDDSKDYWIPPGHHTTIPTTVKKNPLPKKVRVTQGYRKPGPNVPLDEQ
jgi:hypothetical protein